MKLTVATLNIFGIPFYSGKIAARIPRLKQMLQSGPWDLIGLQEDYYFQRRTRWQELAHHTVLHEGHGLLSTGNTQLLKFPPTVRSFHVFRRQGPHPVDVFSGKGVGVVQFRAFERDFSFINTHLVPRRFESLRPVRADQLALLVSVIKSQPSQNHIIVTGDFNIPMHNDEYQTFERATGLLAAQYQGDSFCRNNSFNRKTMGQIDHIWHDRRLHASNTRLGLTQSSEIGHLSDHYMVETELSLS